MQGMIPKKHLIDIAGKVRETSDTFKDNSKVAFIKITNFSPLQSIYRFCLIINVNSNFL